MVNLSSVMLKRELNSKPVNYRIFTKDLLFFASNVDPTTEIARIRHSLSLLETHIVSGGASSTPSQEPSPSNIIAGPIPPPSTPTDPSVKESIPGIYGRHGHRGYYAGPTSAASQLLMVSHSFKLVLPRLLISTTPHRRVRDHELHPKKHPATKRSTRTATTIVI